MSATLPANLPDLLQRAATPQAYCDPASRELIERAWSERPEVVCALVQRAVDLEAELTLARREITHLQQSLLQAGAMAAPVMEGQASRRALGGRRSSSRLTLENIGARFFAHHAGKAWAALLLLAAITVLVQERLL